MSDNAPLVSIIIPVFNGERFLPSALDSVFAQDYRPIEVIVVDDGSIDRTSEIVRKYSEAQYIHQENQGDGAARNTGIAAASGEFIAFLDCDDEWLPTKLRTQMNYLLQNPQDGYVLTRMHVVLESGTEWPAHLNRKHYEQDPICVLPSALLVRRSILNKVGLFNDRYRYATDGDWFFRANDAGISKGVIPMVLVQKRIHPTNQSHEKSVSIDTFAAVRASIQRKKNPAAK
jgi:glycosyltransferase involved in cell wall biosynthesis